MGKIKLRSVEDVYYHLYISRLDTLCERKEHEREIQRYLEDGYTQYGAMNSLILNDERVQKLKDNTFIVNE